MRRVIVFWTVSATVMVSGLAATVVLCSKLISGERAELRSTTEANAQRIGSQVQTGVLAAIDPLERLGRWWLTQGKPTDPEDWATDGQLFMSRSPGLREALWVGRDGWQQWSAVPGGVPNITRTRPDERTLREIASTHSGQPGVISDVFDAPGIGPAFYALFPREPRRTGPRGTSLVCSTRGPWCRQSFPPARWGSIESQLRREAGRSIRPGRWGKVPKRAPTPLSDWGIRSGVWDLHVPLHYFQEFRGLTLAVIGVIGALIYSFGMLLALSQRWSSALQRIIPP